MSQRYEFRLSGSGGQGVITAGIILAEAAILDDKYALQSQSYGPEARGGASKAEVVISEAPIDYPKATVPNYVLCLTNESFRLYGATASKDAIVICDSSVDTSASDKEVIKAPILETAATQLKPLVANVVALGLIVGVTKIVSRDSALKALLSRIPKGTEELNQKALNAGFGFADAL